MNLAQFQYLKYFRQLTAAGDIPFKFCRGDLPFEYYFHIIPAGYLTHDGLYIGILEVEAAVLPCDDVFYVCIGDHRAVSAIVQLYLLTRF